MVRLCGRPGCSEAGAVAYGMVPEDLLFWIAPIGEATTVEPSLLCQRHADAMVVPRGWTLDDRRELMPRLFNTRAMATSSSTPKPKRHRRYADDGQRPEQMQIDGTGEIPRPTPAGDDGDHASSPEPPPESWQPDFDVDDDLDGLLQVDSPLLARAFRGTDRPKR